MDDLYDGAFIPDGDDLHAAFASSSTSHPAGVDLDLSGHSSGSSLLDSDSSDDDEGPTDGNGRHRKGRTHAAPVERRARRVPEADLDTPAVLAGRLRTAIIAVEHLLDRAEAAKLRHVDSDFVAAERCQDIGCCIIGWLKFRKRIACERQNVTTALQRLQNAFPEVLPHGAAADPAAPVSAERHQILVKAHQTLECTSLGHLELIIRCLETEADVVSICVPVSSAGVGDGAKGEPSRGHQGKARGTAVPATRLEVDVVSANGLRWIKVRSSGRGAKPAPRATHSDLEYAEQLRDYVRCAKTMKFAFCQHPEVALLLAREPAPDLAAALANAGVRLAAATAAHRGPDTPFFPPRPLQPPFICLDTTALISICSQSCYGSEMGTAARLAALASYKVMTSQVLSEAQESTVVDGAIERTLREFTRWGTLVQFEREMEMTLIRPRDGETVSKSAAWRRRYQTVSLSLPNIEWAEILPAKGSSSPTEESPVVCAVDRQREEYAEEESRPEDRQRPNWVITDWTYDEFRWMIETIAGRSETKRAQRLLQNVAVIDTGYLRRLPEPNTALVAKGQVMSFLQCLPENPKIQRRNRVVFSCADSLHSVILTANKGVVNAAREQGIYLWARPHNSRSLTELYMHGECRHEGPVRPPPFGDEEADEKFHCV